jgi:hypothetical protein
MSLLISKRAFQTALIQHIGRVYLTKAPTYKYTLSDLFGNKKSWTSFDRLLLNVANDISKRGKLRMNLWLTLVAQYLPRGCKSKRTNKLLDLAEETLRKVEYSLDIGRIIDSQQDTENLLNSIMSRESVWLFKHQENRVVSTESNKYKR